MSSSDLPHGGMFINYRRSDSQYAAGRLADSLVRAFGDIRVFRDLRDMPAGHDFSEVLEQSLSECNTMLVLIGENWLTARDDSGHFRITNEHDWVRREIESALGRNIRVIPVLIDLARLPPAHSLPATLAPLARRQAVRLTDEHWDRDVETLIQSLRKDLKLPEQHDSTLAAAHILRRAGTTLASLAPQAHPYCCHAPSTADWTDLDLQSGRTRISWQLGQQRWLAACLSARR
jgi:TIR domain